MSLLKGMLEKDPRKRLSAEEALDHPAFTVHLSKSPLIKKNLGDDEKLQKWKNLIENEKTIKQKLSNVGEIPDQIEDLSPMPTKNKKQDF